MKEDLGEGISGLASVGRGEEAGWVGGKLSCTAVMRRSLSAPEGALDLREPF